MLTVAIIATLAAIAIPRFGNLIIRSKESSVMAKLGYLRGAFNIYFADTEGIRPDSGLGLTAALTAGGRYLDMVPMIDIPNIAIHSIKCNGITTTFDDSRFDGTDPAKSEAWFYNTLLAKVYINCLHTSSKGDTWSVW